MHPAESSRSRLAERLYQLRKDAGLTGDQLAALLRWEKAGRTKVSKIENGRQVPSADEVTEWASVTGHPDETDVLLDLLADLLTAHTHWRRRLREGQAAVQQDLDRRTQAATRFRNVEVTVIPGLLQTSGYARSIVMMASALFGTRDVDAAVQARMRRQDVLYDSSKTFEFIITEAVLRLLPCPRQVMLGQLDRLMSLSMDNVTIGILPLGTELTFTPLSGLMLLDDDLTVETWAGKIEEHAGEQAAISHRIFDMLTSEAVTGDAARRLIAKAAEDLRESP